MNRNDILFATIDDIPSILSIIDENLIKNKNKTQSVSLQEEGFLILPLTYDDIVKLISNKDKNIVLVSKHESSVIGYTIAYDLNQCDPGWSTRVHFVTDVKNTLLSSKVLYHKQIARQKNAKGVGKALLEELFKQAILREYAFIICHIVHKPIPNLLSKQFHEAFGFKQIGYEMLDSNEVGVYLKEL